MWAKEIGNGVSICVVTLGLLLNGCSSTQVGDEPEMEVSTETDAGTSTEMQEASGVVEEDLDQSDASSQQEQTVNADQIKTEPSFEENADDSEAFAESTGETSVIEESNSDAPVLNSILDPEGNIPSTAGLPAYEPNLPESSDTETEVASENRSLNRWENTDAVSNVYSAEESWATAKNNDAYATYIVRPGDSLSKIAKAVFKDQTRWQELVVENRSDPTLIYPGDVVRFPTEDATAKAFSNRYASIPRTKIVVGPGESLSSIAKRIYGTDNAWNILYSFNKDTIQNPNRIYVGMHLQYIEPSKLSNFALRN